MGEHLRALERLSRKRSWLSMGLTACVLVGFISFVYLVAFRKDIVGHLLMDGLSVGIALGALTMLMVWVVTLIYVLWANMFYDQAVDRIRNICIKKERF